MQCGSLRTRDSISIYRYTYKTVDVLYRYVVVCFIRAATEHATAATEHATAATDHAAAATEHATAIYIESEDGRRVVQICSSM